jgi:hypothetical protein
VADASRGCLACCDEILPADKEFAIWLRSTPHHDIIMSQTLWVKAFVEVWKGSSVAIEGDVVTFPSLKEPSYSFVFPLMRV